MPNSTLTFSEFVDTTSSEQLWQIWNSNAGFNLPNYTQVVFSNYNSATPPQPGNIALINNGVTVATIVITFDGSNNISTITRTS
jgi:hypothetical protein